jgi:heme-degrading monooxygenase HmoA
MVYQPVLTRPASKARLQHKWTSEGVGLLQNLGSNFSLSTLLLVGACFQSLLILTIRSKYALLPAFFVLLLRSADTLLITFKFKPNPYLADVQRGRVTAIVPDEAGEIQGPSAEKVAILLLGAKSNHPMGLFAPEFLEVGKRLFGMNDRFNSADAPEGFMGQTSFERKDERGAQEFVFISYWRNIESLHDFAHTGLHRDTWLWWEKNLKRMDAVGINHEIYQAEPGAWENVYVNFQPTMLGATSFLKKGKKVVAGQIDDKWIHPLVDAQRGKLAKSSGRLGWNPTQHDAVRPAGETYGTSE